MTTLCPTCGYPRETFASDEGTGGFVPYKPVDSSQPIDIEKEMIEVFNAPYPLYEFEKWGKSIAARVEESTIERCETTWEILKDAPEVERLYAPAALGKGETK